MRNLIPVHRASIRTGEQCPSELATVVINEDGNPLFIFTNGQRGDPVDVYEKVDNQWNWWPQWEGDEIMAVLPGQPTVFALKSGLFVEATSEAAYMVGGIETEILGAAWAPDGEIGIFVTKDKVMFMSRSLDPISDLAYSDKDLSLSKHVSVGWGQKETQFQGRGARAARDPTMPEKVDTGVLAKTDKGQVTVSWQGNGEHVAVSSSESGRRTIRVYTREGTIVSISEPIDNLAPLVAWRPSGATIASIQTVSGEVVFFERNGLKRNSFKLTHNEQVTGLAWSFDSEILAVQYPSRVELWTTKNYHWYRKQVLLSTNGYSTTKWIYWHPEKRTILICWGEVVETYSFAVGIFSGGTGSEADDGTVAVIDGDKIKITPLATCNFPPPMSKFAVAVKDSVHVAISDNRELAVTTVDGFYYKEALLKPEGSPRQAAFNDNELVTLCDVNGKGVLTVGEVKHKASVYLLKNGYYETIDGSVYDYTHTPVSKFDRPCVDFCVANVDGVKTAFGLTESGVLYGAASGKCRLLAKNITSMQLTDLYLVITTPTLLKFVHLDQQIVPEDTVDSEQCREIERGSLLVTVVPSKMLVVLQAQRGNLETIYPRMLVVHRVRQLLDETNYKDAFASCRVHRVDLQLLYDYNPQLFEQNISKFLKIGESYIDLFLSSLKPENVAHTKYRETKAINPQAFEVKDVNKVCDLMIANLTSRRNIVTALACKIPPDLQGALRACKSEQDIQHLVYLTDAEILYQTALGMYDLELTLKVAQQSQRDPKEYLAFLRARDKENDARRKFNIDDVLKNRSGAVMNLIADPGATDEEVLNYVERYDLHETVLSSTHNKTREALLIESWAEWLLRKARYQESGLQFEYLGMDARAVDAYAKCGDWRRALSIDSSKAKDLAETCVALKMFGDAAEIYDHHLRAVELAIECYCKAFRFDDAILVDKSSDKIDEGLREQFGIVLELLNDCRSQVPAQLGRLRDLREKRQAATQTFELQGGHIVDDMDTMSIAGTETTGASFVTRYTDKTVGTAQTGASRRTQKNRRREERKRARGKKGTVYEEEYLIASMGRLVERVSVTRPDIQRLVDGLVRRRMRQFAQQVYDLYGSVTSLINEHLTEFYTVAEADLERWDEDGNKFYAPAPVAPAIPAALL